MRYFKKFDFIYDGRLKKDLILDYKEVLTCLKRQCYKGAVVLAGGIVEAILINKALTLLPKDKKRVEEKYSELSGTKKRIEEMDLFYLIKALVNLKIITSPQASRSDVLRDYRNLIHPFKKGDRPRKRDAESVIRLLDDLIGEFGKASESSPKKTGKAMLFLTHSKWKNKRERIEYKEILELFYKKQTLSYEELLSLPSFQSRKNPSKSLIAFLNYLKEYDLCSYDPKSWQGYPIKRYEKWILNSKIKKEVGKYLRR